MEFKGTPAPWRCHDKRPNCSGYSIFGNDGQYIGFVGDYDELTPIDANAHLIAAAPELLESLRELVSAMERYEMDSCESAPIKHRVMMNKANSVIAKALGQQ
ncbi:hypothetical protein [Providencia stuartii]|uniref:hypothetical protein n=1 Tax=Providencia stuartii TaxID=588 RepID=UPI0029D78988|nr:hypothetical protein [Providencia stuartii]MDX7495492.1 hypothetical protein [Providencia stuartii]